MSKYIVEKDRQDNGMDYQVVRKNGRRDFRDVICACYYESDSKLIVDALNGQDRKGYGVWIIEEKDENNDWDALSHVFYIEGEDQADVFIDLLQINHPEKMFRKVKYTRLEPQE